jgi:hypothetical protein
MELGRNTAVTAVAKEILEQRERSIGVIARLQPARTNDAVVISEKSPPSLFLSLPFLSVSFFSMEKEQPLCREKIQGWSDAGLKRSQ